MRMTKYKKQLLRLYRRERARGFHAHSALSNARTRAEWEKHTAAEYSNGEPIDPKRGNVRLRVVPDEMCSLEDLEGDCFNSKANPDIPASRLQRDREQFIATVNREGVWGIVGEYFDGENFTSNESSERFWWRVVICKCQRLNNNHFGGPQRVLLHRRSARFLTCNC